MIIAESETLNDTTSLNSSFFKRTDIQETSIVLSERRTHKATFSQAQPIDTQALPNLRPKSFSPRDFYAQHFLSLHSVTQASASTFSYYVSRISASRDDTTQASLSHLISGLERLSIHDYLYSKLSLRLKFWLSEVNFLISEVRLPWVEPLVNYVDQEVSLEWWSANKKLTIYFSDTAIEFIRVWGPDIKNEMEDGEVVNPFSFVALWQWLIS
ncbi:hypothetical protein [Synechococcus sp. CCAP 1479/9]|uniref:hypothetical protein n=1 Tax=Synechococcus sp. CCAP 1479/9 TaxID=1221593 RepID=UPI001C217B61|nr:hypothetical protein [Synechococcus sp. CCAP 1479/9]